MKTFILLLTLVLSGCASTTIESKRDPASGESHLYFNSPKNYGSIKARSEYDENGNLKAMHIEAEGVDNAAAKQQSESFNQFIQALERAYTKTPPPQ